MYILYYSSPCLTDIQRAQVKYVDSYNLNQSALSRHIISHLKMLSFSHSLQGKWGILEKWDSRKFVQRKRILYCCQIVYNTQTFQARFQHSYKRTEGLLLTSFSWSRAIIWRQRQTYTNTQKERKRLLFRWHFLLFTVHLEMYSRENKVA